MNDFYSELKEYFNSNPKEKILEDWSKSEREDQVGPSIKEFFRKGSHTVILGELFKERLHLCHILNMIEDRVITFYNQEEMIVSIKLRISEITLIFFKEQMKYPWKEDKGWKIVKKDEKANLLEDCNYTEAIVGIIALLLYIVLITIASIQQLN